MQLLNGLTHLFVGLSRKPENCRSFAQECLLHAERKKGADWAHLIPETCPRESDSRWCNSNKQPHAWKPAAVERLIDCEWSWFMMMPFVMMRAHTQLQNYTPEPTQAATHSDVQTHIPLWVGSWSKVRKCEICQPIGDWVIEEFDSERNILLPWWWTRRNHTIFSRRKVWQKKQEIDH